jgi:hypothetical protein
MQDWKDSDLKTLFRKMRERDHESATPFLRDWELARSRMAASHRTSFRYAMAIASLIVVAFSAAVVVRILRVPSPQPEQRAGLQNLPYKAPGNEGTPTLLPDVSPPVSPATPVKRIRSVRRAPSRPQGPGEYYDRQLISTWRSPTDFLLKSPGDDLLRTIPNIQDSLGRIDGR